MMNTVKHKDLGVGEIIERKHYDNSTTITVRFENSVEKKFAIPQSFMNGILEVEGDLKDEVDTAIALVKEEFNEKVVSGSAERLIRSTTASAERRSHKSSVKSAPRRVAASSFEEYLIKAGYKVETDSGTPSTVYSYINAIDSVLENEGITYSTLVADIDNIIKKYDIGGAEESFGNKSNKTVINALKRFRDFINP